MILYIDDIKKLIPHRKPFLFIEECKVIVRGKIGESFRTFAETIQSMYKIPIFKLSHKWLNYFFNIIE